MQRKRLRRHPRIVNELERWWAAILRCNERDGAITVPAIHFDVYSAMIKRLYMELVDEYDEADACATSHEDWEADSQGHPSLDRARFHDCIFEVADQYVRDLGADDYISFLSDLYTEIFDSNDRLRGWWPNEHSDDGDDDDDVFPTQGPVAHPSGRCALGSSRKLSRDQRHAVRSSPAPAPFGGRADASRHFERRAGESCEAFVGSTATPEYGHIPPSLCARLGGGAGAASSAYPLSA